MRKLGNEYGATTGRPRRCGWFDAIVVEYATRVNGLSDLAVTKLDVLDTLDRLGVCVGYEIDGELHEEFPGDLVKLDCVKPKYEWFDGWKRSTADGAHARAICRARRAAISTGSRRSSRRRSRTSASGPAATRSSACSR